VEAIHLEEPEFWVLGGYSEGFKREWRDYYREDWQPPHSSVDAQWRASKLKYFLYRRALQQVFNFVQDFDKRTGRHVRCYVPTHSLLNYAHWRIVSPESSLARLNGCDGYIAQVWTGTARTPNLYRGELRERTFETAFLEYGAMQNLVRATGRRVWYLNDPVEDNPNHDWEDYRLNWEATLTASLFQPEVWRYEVAPWPERIFAGKYPRKAKAEERQSIPAAYATELQTVMNALNHMNQRDVTWDCGTTGIGVLVSDSLMFERGEPSPSDAHLSHVYGLALPLLKRGMPITPVQLENLQVGPKYLEPFRLLLLSYHGLKPLTAKVHSSLAKWVKDGGILLVIDDDSDPYNRVREWWNTPPFTYSSPRVHLFSKLGLADTNLDSNGKPLKIAKGVVAWLREDPAGLASNPKGDQHLVSVVKDAASVGGLKWHESNHLLLRRGPYIIGAGLEESTAGATTTTLHGRFVNLFDPQLRLLRSLELSPGARCFALDLDQLRGSKPRLVASACKAVSTSNNDTLSLAVEGVAGTPSMILIQTAKNRPKKIMLSDQVLEDYQYSAADHLLWIRFQNSSKTRSLKIDF
jgi:hypothetical protein